MEGLIRALRLVPWWAWAGALLLGLLGAQTLRVERVQVALAREQRDRKDERLRLVERGLKATEAALQEGNRRVAAIKKVLDDTQPQLEAARAAADRIPDLDRRLRAATAALWAARRAAPADPAAAPGGPAADPAAGVLAELQRSAQDAEAARARYADEAAAAGERCAAVYESLTPGPAVRGAE